MPAGDTHGTYARRREREAKRAASWRKSVLNYSPRGVVPAWAGAIISTFRFCAVDELMTFLAAEALDYSEGAEQPAACHLARHAP